MIRIYQNYPNPFNLTTSLRFELPEVSNVKLNVYNMLGQEVITLINTDNMNPGYHQTYWNGADRTGKAVASGLYFYRFEAVGQETGKKYANIGKMILLK
ncbi:MAG: T9SS type A sorting domain-containing protein [candidate division Zixibacteria bacterium]|nr:T9SS type A sorting domain-containing protein [Candidatus Tariuqbacter arcticus]